MTAEYDPLRSRGRGVRARGSREAGVPVRTDATTAMIHGFVRMPALVEEALHALDEVAAAVRRSLGAL